jgi:hypothetical protein
VTTTITEEVTEAPGVVDPALLESIKAMIRAEMGQFKQQQGELIAQMERNKVPVEISDDDDDDDDDDDEVPEHRSSNEDWPSPKRVSTMPSTYSTRSQASKPPKAKTPLSKASKGKAGLR